LRCGRRDAFAGRPQTPASSEECFDSQQHQASLFCEVPVHRGNVPLRLKRVARWSWNTGSVRTSWFHPLRGPGAVPSPIPNSSPRITSAHPRRPRRAIGGHRESITGGTRCVGRPPEQRVQARVRTGHCRGFNAAALHLVPADMPSCEMARLPVRSRSTFQHSSYAKSWESARLRCAGTRAQRGVSRIVASTFSTSSAQASQARSPRMPRRSVM